MNKQERKIPKPHPHAKEIVAWATKGALIEYYDEFFREWMLCLDNHPAWNEYIKYRIRPEYNDPCKPEHKDPWKPESGETYRFITSTGKVVLKTNQDEAQDINRIAIGNCFPDSEAGIKQALAAAERVKAAMKGEVGDKVMSREEADIAMRSSIGICAIIDKNTYLLRENNKLKEELESFITRCEYLQKAKEQLTASHAAVDGKPLSDGEKALIKALRKTWGFAEITKPGDAVVVSKNKNGVYKSTTHNISILLIDGEGSDAEIVDALKVINEEHKIDNERALRDLEIKAGQWLRDETKIKKEQEGKQ